MPLRHPTWLRIAATASFYLAAGKLSQLLTAPPLYSTAVWPAAGIALALAIAWGTRVVPGVFVGQSLVILTTSFDASSTGALVRSLAMAAGIGCGAALHAYVGARLVRRFVGDPPALVDEREVARFLAAGGLVAPLCSATVGVAVLFACGQLGAGTVVQTWCTWWVGDAIGVFTATPLVLLACGEPRPLWRRRARPVGAVLSVALALAVGAFLFVNAEEARVYRRDFAQEVGARVIAIAEHMRSALDDLEALEALFASEARLERAQFATFCGHLLRHDVGVLALCWLPRMLPDQVAACPADADASGRGVWEGAAADRRAVAPRGDYYPIVWIEPLAGNEAAVGFDTGSTPERRAAIDAAVADGAPTATASVQLVQRPGGGPGCLIFQPIRGAAGGPHAGALLGLVSAVVGIDELLATPAAPLAGAGIVLELRDLDARPATLARSGDLAAALPGEALRQRLPVAVPGRRWQAEFAATPAFLAGRRPLLAWTVLTGGMLCCGLLGFALLVITGRTATVHELVDARTRELSATNDRLSAAVAEHARAELALRASQEALRGTLREKESMLQEIHHRVKNNLQVVSSLLDLQAARVGDAATEAVLRESQGRVRAMASIHEALYRSRDLAGIPLRQHVADLCAHLLSSFEGRADRVQLTTAVDDVVLPLAQAVPFGLLLNELVTNALRHAFPAGRKGRIAVEVARRDDGTCTLVVADDGVGLPPGVDPGRSPTLGLQLVTTLARQLGAEVRIEAAAGTAFAITFRPLPPVATP